LFYIKRLFKKNRSKLELWHTQFNFTIRTSHCDRSVTGCPFHDRYGV